MILASVSCFLYPTDRKLRYDTIGEDKALLVAALRALDIGN